jgi:DNA-binding transcriptional MocR family regulator
MDPLAREHQFKIIEDDIYADFQTELTDRLAALDQLEHVIYVGGLSKTLSSSLRIGVVVADHAIIKDLADIKMLTSIGGSRFAEAVAVAMLERGTYRKYLERLRRRMRDALGATVQALEARTRHGSSVTVAPGSYFRPNAEVSPWIRINVAYASDPRAQAFFEAAAKLAR